MRKALAGKLPVAPGGRGLDGIHGNRQVCAALSGSDRALPVAPAASGPGLRKALAGKPLDYRSGWRKTGGINPPARQAASTGARDEDCQGIGRSAPPSAASTVPYRWHPPTVSWTPLHEPGHGAAGTRRENGYTVPFD